MKTILLQFDTDAQPSSFDRVVAVDAGADCLFSYGGVNCDNVTGLVHGAIFTRGPAELQHTAIFVGGSQVAEGERLLQQIGRTFFGPMRVSVMMDSSGCNTTAAAAVASARRHLSLAGTSAVVLGATGPVGQRVAELLVREQAHVTLVSRTRERAEAACAAVRARSRDARVTPAEAGSPEQFEAVCGGQALVVAAGAAGACFLTEGAIQRLPGLQLAIDLNAVPPVGIADIDPRDKAAAKSSVICYGALGVGGLKMKVHRQAVRSLFERNDSVLDTQRIYELALQVAGIA